MNTPTRLLALISLVLGLAMAPVAFAQTLLSEDFTQATTSATSGVGNWLFFNGACLTAGTSTVLTPPSTTIPACTAVLASYYSKAADGDHYLMGGANGFLGGTSAPGSIAAQQPDPAGSGALRFTNGSPYGHQERGAIVSTNAYSSTAGIQVTFKTVTYGGSGADGISFYLMDGCVPVSGAILPPSCAANQIYPTGSPNVSAIGATGGSLAYDCTNNNGPSKAFNLTYDGLTGAYLGLGIDEYGNFLNQGDNGYDATGIGFQPGRIGLRGGGSISWPALNNAYGAANLGPTSPYYPPSLSTTCKAGTYDSASGTCGTCPAGNTYSNGICTNTTTGATSAATVSPTWAEMAVQLTCENGKLYNFANYNGYDGNLQGTSTPTVTNSGLTSAGATTLANTANTAGILDYAPIPGASITLPPGHPLFNGSATTRSQATPIFYNLKITSDGYLSLSYAYNGGAYQQVIANQSIQSSNGLPPAYVRFGFAGSTGGLTNVHEILCFKSAPVVQSGSSAGINQKESAKVESGSFAYFAFYDQDNWVGRVTANALDTDSAGNVSIAGTPTWDASCDLTGVPTGQTCSTGVAGPTAALTPSSRVILTYNGGGKAFEWTDLSAAQQAALNLEPGTTYTDSNSTPWRFNYLRGDRTNEINSAGTCSGNLYDTTVMPNEQICFRARTSILADIVDSSPTWVGPPNLSYTQIWADKLYPTSDVMQENSGAQNYLQYQGTQGTRANVVYVGSNDGMMHGFRSGSYLAGGTFSTATTPNDGMEVLAYMPGSLLASAANNNNPACSLLTPTGSIVQNIHGVTPLNGANAACVTPALDFSNTQYGHDFYVDATPGSGDLYYGGTWHTWLVSGLGAGGAAIFALDVSDPTTFSEANASSLVIGEWTSATINCVGNATCGKSMGNTFGTPIIRRLHDGRWGVIFGNGFGSSTGDAGIFVMTVDSTGAQKFYYLSTGNTGTNKNNGIAYVSSADLDGDHITDYVYAGDLMGNVWRFDLTSATETTWAVSSPGPLFTTPTGQPITTSLTVSSGATPAGANTIMIGFGSGMRTQFTNAAAVAYQTATQSLYGVWDWNMSNWNSKSAVQYASLTSTASGLSAPNYTLQQANLQSQTFVLNADGVTRDIPNPTAICWAGSATCTGTPKFGWYLNLIGAEEQIVFNPELVQGVFVVNSTVPANNQALACTTNLDTGFTYAISMLTGAAVPNFFIGFHDAGAGGRQLNAVGTTSVVTSPTGLLWGVFQTAGGGGGTSGFNPGANGKGRRLTWVQLR